jgi:hypothetical protein
MNGPSYVSSLQLAGPLAYDVAGVGDFNADGKLDLLWQHPANGDVWTWYLDNGVYAGSAPIAGPMTYKVLGWR